MTANQENKLIQKLAQSKRFYILWLNKSCSSFSLYYETKDRGLEVVWPEDCHLGKESKDRKLLGMTYSKRESLPAFHFHMNGWGYSKRQEIEERLRDLTGNKTLEVYRLNGHSPSNSF